MTAPRKVHNTYVGLGYSTEPEQVQGYAVRQVHERYEVLWFQGNYSECLGSLTDEGAAQAAVDHLRRLSEVA